MPAKRVGGDHSFQLAGTEIAPGSRQIVDLPISLLSNHTPMNLSVQVINGRRPGPVLFVSAAVHGDEIMGVEIIRRVLASSWMRQVRSGASAQSARSANGPTGLTPGRLVVANTGSPPDAASALVGHHARTDWLARRAGQTI